jgi:regulator of sirC expression with transglutaminase-like and TPR domain
MNEISINMGLVECLVLTFKQNPNRSLEALEDFKSMMRQPDEEINLLESAVLIARHRHPLLDHVTVVEQLDDLALHVEALLPPSSTRYPMKILQTVSRHLYIDSGFSGNSMDYYDPDNR